MINVDLANVYKHPVQVYNYIQLIIYYTVCGSYGMCIVVVKVHVCAWWSLVCEQVVVVFR